MWVFTVLGLTKSFSAISSFLAPGLKISITTDFHSKLVKLKQYSRLRPKPYTKLDQAYATPETALRRALYMMAEGDLEGRDVLFLGDDDLTSLAAGLLKIAKSITVIDIDVRILDLIDDISRREKLG